MSTIEKHTYAFIRLSNAVVLTLTGARLRDLRMLLLVLGSKITDASVVSIVSFYTYLELLDLSGSSISDSGIGMICGVYPETLSRLLFAFCPNITLSGIQFATSQLPFLQLIDCGMNMPDNTSQNDVPEGDFQYDDGINKIDHCERPLGKLQPIYQKLIIKHARLRKLSLWGCSGLYRMLLQCSNLEKVHASECVTSGSGNSRPGNDSELGSVALIGV